MQYFGLIVPTQYFFFFTYHAEVATFPKHLTSVSIYYVKIEGRMSREVKVFLASLDDLKVFNLLLYFSKIEFRNKQLFILPFFPLKQWYYCKSLMS